MDVKQAIAENKTTIGIELGSTRIKAVLIDTHYAPIASGAYDWENRLEDGVWTYHLDDVWKGLQGSFQNLAADVQKRYGVKLVTVGAVGISAMMHGYLAFNKSGELLVPFRTWRNTTTEKAAAALTKEFQFNIPQRWSIAHLYQAILNKEDHVKDLAFLTTLAGYVHWKLTGQKVLGIDDASGMFPIDSTINNYNQKMLQEFKFPGFSWNIGDLLPKVLVAGENAGVLTAEGAKLLDPSGSLRPGIPLCPPEGDAGTGMVATNSVAERTGNVSAGTSIFAMIVMEKELSKVYPEIDIVTTPAGKPVAMVHCNNCTSDIDAWIKLFRELLDISGAKIDKAALYDTLYFKALEANDDCGGLLSYNYYSGEIITGIEEGRPLFARLPDSNFNLANFMRTLLFSSMATLKYGIDILEREQVRIDSLLGHGGLFKTKGVGQRYLAAVFNAPVSVMESAGKSGEWDTALLAKFMREGTDIAGEGGAWGIALLAAFMREGADILEKFLSEKVFAGKTSTKIEPNPKDVASFGKFMKRYTAGLKIERAAVENLKKE